MTSIENDMASSDEVERILRAIRADEGLRERAEAAILSADLLTVPKRLESLAGTVQTLAGTVGQLAAVSRSFAADLHDLVELSRSHDGRLEKIDGRLDGLEKGQAGLQTSVARLEKGQAGLQTSVARLEKGQAGLQTSVARLEKGQAGLQKDVAGIRSEIGKMNERLGEVTEDGADAVLAAVLAEKGCRLLGEPVPVQLAYDEVDVALAFDDGSGPKTAVVEVKFRLRGRDVSTFARKVHSPSWAAALHAAGFNPPWVPYIYGSRVYADALSALEGSGLGLLSPGGERRAPTPIAA